MAGRFLSIEVSGFYAGKLGLDPPTGGDCNKAGILRSLPHAFLNLHQITEAPFEYNSGTERRRLNDCGKVRLETFSAFFIRT